MNYESNVLGHLGLYVLLVDRENLITLYILMRIWSCTEPDLLLHFLLDHDGWMNAEALDTYLKQLRIQILAQSPRGPTRGRTKTKSAWPDSGESSYYLTRSL